MHDDAPTPKTLQLPGNWTMQLRDGPFKWFGKQWDQSIASSGGFLIAVIIAWAFELVYSLTTSAKTSQGLANFCLLWFVSGAAFFLGAISGILFGLPRSQDQQSKERTSSDPDTGVRRYRANTNLEDVSDWLTKIIIGIGIAEFHKVLAFFRYVSAMAGKGLNVGPGGEVVALGSIIYGLICGFLYYYVWARITLQRNLEAPDATHTKL